MTKEFLFLLKKMPIREGIETLATNQFSNRVKQKRKRGKKRKKHSGTIEGGRRSATS